MKIIKNTPPKNKYILMKRYHCVTIIKKVSTKLTGDFFKVFPEEKRGRKSFKSKEKEIMTLMAYNELIEKAIKVECHCIGNTREFLEEERLEVSASFYKMI